MQINIRKLSLLLMLNSNIVKLCVAWAYLEVPDLFKPPNESVLIIKA